MSVNLTTETEDRREVLLEAICAELDRHLKTPLQEIVFAEGKKAQALLDDGLIVELSDRQRPAEDDERRRYYRITDSGRAMLASQREDWGRFIAALTLVAFIGAWALITGVLEIAAAVRLRREIENEWLLGIGGVLSVGLGILLIARPQFGQVTLQFFSYIW